MNLKELFNKSIYGSIGYISSQQDLDLLETYIIYNLPVLEGFKTYAPLHDTELFALYHPKTINKQEKQNAYYETL